MECLAPIHNYKHLQIIISETPCNGTNCLEFGIKCHSFFDEAKKVYVAVCECRDGTLDSSCQPDSQ